MPFSIRCNEIPTSDKARRSRGLYPGSCPGWPECAWLSSFSRLLQDLSDRAQILLAELFLVELPELLEVPGPVGFRQRTDSRIRARRPFKAVPDLSDLPIFV